MKNNYIQNKLAFVLGICAILLKLSNSSTLAQPRKPTPAEIQQAKTSLRQQLESLKSNNLNHYLQDGRTPKQIQERNKLVDAWKPVKPEVASFLGGWSGYESGWMIYPSNTTDKVCVIKTDEEGNVNTDIGTVIANTIHTDKGMVLFKDDNYLGVGKIDNNRFVQINDVPLSSPTALTEPYLFKDINGFSPSYQQLKPYADAGCTASAPSENKSERTALGDLPDGDYTYGQLPYPKIVGANYLAFRKSGNVVAGISYDYQSDGFPCLLGAVQGDSVTDVTWITRPMGEPGAKDIVEKSESFSLNDYYRIDNQEKKVASLLNGCISTIVENIPQSADSILGSIKIPDSFDLAFDNNKMKSKFVKGADGYYTWYLTSYFIPDTCLGLKENEDPTKVQVKMYGCDSKKKATKWEIVLVEDNTGYKIKLPKSNLCLGYEKGVFDCDSTQAQVEKLTPEQLKSWRSKQ